jgi:hypothetical protein
MSALWGAALIAGAGSRLVKLFNMFIHTTVGLPVSTIIFKKHKTNQ